MICSSCRVEKQSPSSGLSRVSPYACACHHCTCSHRSLYQPSLTTPSRWKQASCPPASLSCCLFRVPSRRSSPAFMAVRLFWFPYLRCLCCPSGTWASQGPAFGHRSPWLCWGHGEGNGDDNGTALHWTNPCSWVANSRWPDVVGDTYLYLQSWVRVSWDFYQESPIFQGCHWQRPPFPLKSDSKMGFQLAKSLRQCSAL